MAADAAAGDELVASAIGSGRAFDVFRATVVRQGGDPAVIDDPARLAATSTRGRVAASRSGFVTAIDAASIGRASMMLGAGRERLDTPIHHGAGVTIEAPVGSAVQAGATLATLHVGRPERREDARALVAAAFEIEDAPPPPSPLVYDVVS